MTPSSYPRAVWALVGCSAEGLTGGNPCAEDPVLVEATRHIAVIVLEDPDVTNWARLGSGFQRSVDDDRRQGPLEQLSHIAALQGLSRALWEYGGYSDAESVAHEMYQISQHMEGPTPAGGAMATLEWGHCLAFTGSTRHGLKLLQQEIPSAPDVSSVVALRERRHEWSWDGRLPGSGGERCTGAF